MDDEADRTLYCGNLAETVTEELLFELFTQAGPVDYVKFPKGKDGKQRNFAFIIFKHNETIPYVLELLEGAQLFGRTIKLNFSSEDKRGNRYRDSTSEPSSPSMSSPMSCNSIFSPQQINGFLNPDPMPFVSQTTQQHAINQLSQTYFTQLSPIFSNQFTPNFHNQMTPNYSNQLTPNYSRQHSTPDLQREWNRCNDGSSYPIDEWHCDQGSFGPNWTRR